jgi:hypothetical protein
VNETGEQCSPIYGCYNVSKAEGMEHGAVQWEGDLVKKKCFEEKM